MKLEITEEEAVLLHAAFNLFQESLAVSSATLSTLLDSEDEKIQSITQLEGREELEAEYKNSLDMLKQAQSLQNKLENLLEGTSQIQKPNWE